MINENILGINRNEQKSWLSIFKVFTAEYDTSFKAIIKEITEVDSIEVRARLLMALAEDFFKNKRALEAVFFLEKAISESTFIRDEIKRLYVKTRYYYILDRYTSINHFELEKEIKKILEKVKLSYCRESSRSFLISIFEHIRRMDKIDIAFRKCIFKQNQELFNKVYLDYIENIDHQLELSPISGKNCHKTFLYVLECVESVDLDGIVGKIFRCYIRRNMFIRAFDILLRFSVNERSEAIMLFFNIICRNNIQVSNVLGNIIKKHIKTDPVMFERILFANKTKRLWR